MFSALPLKADIAQYSRYVRFVPMDITESESWASGRQKLLRYSAACTFTSENSPPALHDLSTGSLCQRLSDATAAAAMRAEALHIQRELHLARTHRCRHLAIPENLYSLDGQRLEWIVS